MKDFFSTLWTGLKVMGAALSICSVAILLVHILTSLGPTGSFIFGILVFFILSYAVGYVIKEGI